MTTSATGGYLVQTEVALPGGLSLTQYIQQVIVGITGLQGTLVRPKWQKNPPKVLPNPEDNYCAFRVTTRTPDASAFHKLNDNGNGSVLQRHVELAISCSFYGSDCEKNAALLSDGLEIAQNRDALKAANIGVKDIGVAIYVPELHGQVWYPRCDITIVLKRQIDKNFSVLSFTGSVGTIEGQKSNDETENVPWNVSEQ
jgi:hypothetical protein